MAVPVYWLARAGVPVRARWDEDIVEDLLAGTKKHPAGLPKFEHRFDPPDAPVPFALVVFAAGTHGPQDIDWLNPTIAPIERVVLFVTSDESATFRAEELSHPDLRLWIQTPHVGLRYPSGTVFFGLGSADSHRGPSSVGPVDKKRSWFFAGQVNRDTPLRHEMIEVLNDIPDGEAIMTPAFLQGLERREYLTRLGQARVAPCPSGFVCQDTFRLYEALEMGCIPVVPEYRNDGDGAGFWNLMDFEMERIVEWDEFPVTLARLEAEWPLSVVRPHAWWHSARRAFARTLVHQCPPQEADGTIDAMTAIIPTSPIPSHPSIDIIAETIASIRDRTDAEIIISVDGVRPEQRDRSDDYYEYVRRLLLHCEHETSNVTPLVFYEHLHQAEMLRRTLKIVDSPFMLYVEHDTPLTGDIPFPAILRQMERSKLNTMRFSHESEILEVHHHLTVDLQPRGDAPFVPTLQWSQRPHIARREFYEHLLNTYFTRQARTMIEDVMHGVTEVAAFSGKMAEGWESWRMGVYHPEGDIKRSLHLDGRAGDVKYPMRFAYPGGVTPDGAPRQRNA